MMNKLILTAAIGAVMLAGCASKKLPVDGNTYAPGAGEPYTAPDSLAGLQADLVAAAGSDRVFFGYDAYTLTAEARQTLARQAGWLRQHPDVGFSIEGHCDERGTRDYNLALGDRRARAAAAFLASEGIAPTRIRTISYGKERPEALGSDDGSYAANRRAVSIVIGHHGE
jgi:peptidoglycan-associated lipoprotein